MPHSKSATAVAAQPAPAGRSVQSNASPISWLVILFALLATVVFVSLSLRQVKGNWQWSARTKGVAAAGIIALVSFVAIESEVWKIVGLFGVFCAVFYMVILSGESEREDAYWRRLPMKNDLLRRGYAMTKALSDLAYPLKARMYTFNLVNDGKLNIGDEVVTKKWLETEKLAIIGERVGLESRIRQEYGTNLLLMFNEFEEPFRINVSNARGFAPNGSVDFYKIDALNSELHIALGSLLDAT